MIGSTRMNRSKRARADSIEHANKKFWKMQGRRAKNYIGF